MIDSCVQTASLELVDLWRGLGGDVGSRKRRQSVIAVGARQGDERADLRALPSPSSSLCLYLLLQPRPGQGVRRQDA